MMNQAVVEALYSATYVEDYIDACENLPDDIQRQLSRMRELDSTVQGYMRDSELLMEKLLDLQDNDSNGEVNSVSIRLQQLLISAQEAGDEKLQVAQQIQDFVDNKVRQLDLDKKNLDIATDSAESQPSSSTRGEAGTSSSSKQNGTGDRVIKRARRAKHEVFVPSILGPTTLAATRYAGDDQREKTQAHPTEKSKKEKDPSTKTKSAGASAASREEKESKKAEKAANRPSVAKVKASKAATEESGGTTPSKSSDKVKIAATISASTITPASASSSAGNVDRKSAGATASAAAEKVKNVSQQENTSGVSTEKMATMPQSSASSASANTSASTSTSGGNGSAGAVAGTSASGAAASTSASGDSSSTPSKQESKKKAAEKAAAAAEEKKKYKKRKSKQEDSPPNIPIDPDEPTYCLCDQVSYGEMIGCDNDLCPIEWFHFSCVSLSTKPKGKWFCPKCRGDRPNVMKPKGIFLKELEKYNREKEEKN